MARLWLSGLLVEANEQWEFDHPYVAVGPLPHWWAAKVVADLTQDFACGVPRIGHDENQVAGLCLEAGNQRSLLVGAEELGNWRFEAAVGGNLEPHQALGAHLLGAIGERIELVAAQLFGLTRGIDALNACCTRKRFELGCGKDVGEFVELHTETKVGLVDTEAVHGIAPCHLLDGRWTLARDGFGRSHHSQADGCEDVVLADKAHLGVELHELVLAIGAQVFVAKATSDLVVAIHTSHHQQLLEQLWALRQRVERAWLFAARHQELAGALGSRRHQHWSLYFDEALRFHRAADGRVHLGAYAEVLLHALAADVEVAELQAGGLFNLVGA